MKHIFILFLGFTLVFGGVSRALAETPAHAEGLLVQPTVINVATHA